MGSFSIWHWLVVGIILLLLFGKGRFSEMMGDVAKGIKSFKKGMTEDEEAAAQAAQAARDQGPPRQIDARPAEATIVQPDRAADPAPAERAPGDGREA
jgi:sec-independent protein translocase protein TatA